MLGPVLKTLDLIRQSTAGPGNAFLRRDTTHTRLRVYAAYYAAQFILTLTDTASSTSRFQLSLILCTHCRYFSGEPIVVRSHR